MKILALVTDAFGSQYGIAQYNRDFLSALTSMNGETSIVVLTRAGNPNQETPPARIQWKGAYKSKWRYVLATLYTFLTEKNFDLIFCGHLHLAPLAAFLSTLTNVPFWLQLYGVDAWDNRSILRRWAAKKASLVIAISRYTRRQFLAWSGVSPEKVRILPCTVDERFQPGPKPDYLLERYRLAGKKVLLTVSRLSSRENYKGQDQMIHLLPELLRKYPNLVYIIAGDGDDRPRLEKLAREKTLDGSVRFIGQVKESELPDVYRMADLFVMPSTGEGFGITFLEAACCKIPVIGGKTDGSMDALREGRIGKVVDPGNPEELARAIEDSLNSRGPSQEEVEIFSRGRFSHHVTELVKRLGQC